MPAIRPASASDADALLRLLNQLGYGRLERSVHANVVGNVLARPDIRVEVAEDDDGRLLGMLSLSHRPQLRLGGTLVTVDELVVAEGARGRGVGRALLDRAKEVARELGARRLELHTNRARDNYVRGFYPKNGFIEVNSAVMRLEALER